MATNTAIRTAATHSLEYGLPTKRLSTHSNSTMEAGRDHAITIADNVAEHSTVLGGYFLHNFH
jgi:hypothetical protein